MKHLCLGYGDETALHEAADSPRDGECPAHDEALRERGYLIASEALAPVHTATTVRVRHGDASVVDGPFAETREQLAGFLLIEARDLNEAIGMASRVPAARVGSVETRPVRRLEPASRAAAG